MMFRRLEEETGFALVTALMVSFVVLILGMAVVQLSLHNSTASGYDRKRVQTISAAEAGLDYYYSYLQSTGGQSPACSVTKPLTTSPAATFTVTPTFYNSSGVALACPLPTGVIPASVRLRSVGTSSTGVPARAMESFATLTLTQGSTFDNAGAIVGNTAVNFEANAQIGGDLYNDADTYTNGSLTLSANSTLYGKLYAQGSVIMKSNSEVKKDVWANGSITMQGSRIRGNATSSTSSISLQGGSRIYGNAKAGTTISSGSIDGFRTPNSPSGPPPSRAYPVFTFVSSDWHNAGYTIHTYSNDCVTPLNSTNLRNWWGAASGTHHVIRITGSCALTLATPNVSVKGNLAIIADGSVTLDNAFRFTPQAGPWNLFLFGGMASGPGCELRTKPHSGADSGLITMIYVPAACSVTMESNSGISEGQIMGGTVTFKHTVSFQYKRATLPGTGSGGFKQDISYKREVV